MEKYLKDHPYLEPDGLQEAEQLKKENLNEEEPFQKAVKTKHQKMKIRLIGLGGGKNTRGTKKPSYKRSKSAPPGFGGALEESN